MSLGISTLKKGLGTLSLGILLLLGMSVSTQAQRRQGPPPWAPAYGRRNERPYGQDVSARRHARNELRREMRQDQRDERRTLNDRLRYQRRVYGNSPTLRYQRRIEQRNQRLLQRDERGDFNRSWRNNRGWRH